MISNVPKISPRREIPPPLEQLAFRIRENVALEASPGLPVLVLKYPLKFITLHGQWRPLIEYMAGLREYITIDRITRITGTGPPETEKFLSGLVRKGFLEQKGVSSITRFPFVSVIIPVRNRPAEISECLESLLAVDYPQELLEIIVVDDASTDNTPQVVSLYPVRLISLRENRGASHCRNLAGRQARGDLLAFIDSDCIASPEWLRQLVPAFKDDAVSAVGGLVDSYYEEKSLDKYEKVKSSLIIGTWFKRSEKKDRFFYVPSCNLIIRRGTFLKLGGFEETLHVGEDVDLCWRLQDGGHELEYRPQGRILHKHRNELGAFARRRYDYGTSEPILQKRHTSRRKKLELPIWNVVFWTAVLMALVFKAPLAAFLALLAVSAESLAKKAMISRYATGIGMGQIAISCARANLSFLLGLFSFTSRYYLILMCIILPLSPIAGLGIAAAHLITGAVEFAVRKPGLNAPAFFFFFSVEQLSYQSGVWARCWKEKTFNPVNPEIAIRL